MKVSKKKKYRAKEQLPPLQMLNPNRNIILHKSQPRPVLSGQFTVITVGSPGFSAWLMRTKSSCKMPILSLSLFLQIYSAPPLTLFFVPSLYSLSKNSENPVDKMTKTQIGNLQRHCLLLTELQDWRFRQIHTEKKKMKEGSESLSPPFVFLLVFQRHFLFLFSLQSFSISRIY